MSTEQYANNAQSSLAGAVTAGATSLTVASAAAFPASGQFRLLIGSEILLVTAVAGNTFTVSRGQEGTVAAAHAAGAAVACVLTAAALLNDPRAMTTAGDLEYLGAGGAVTRLPVGSAGQVLGVSGGLPAWVTGGGGGGDMLAAGVNAITTVTNADANLAYATWTVVKATTANHTVTLPAPALASGKPQLVAVKVDPASTKLVTLAPHAAETIDGASSRVLWAGEFAVLLTDGTNWFKVDGQSYPMACRLALSAAQSISNDTLTRVNLDTTLVDNTGLMADTSNHRVAIQRAGSYVVTGTVSYPDEAGTVQVFCFLYQNTTKLGSAGVIGEPATVTGPVLPITAAAGDHIFLDAYEYGATSANLRADGSATSLYVQEVPSW